MMSLYSMAVTRVKHIKQWNANIFFSSCRSCSSAVIFAHQLSYLFISCYFCLSVAIFIHKFGLLVLGFVFFFGGGGLLFISCFYWWSILFVHQMLFLCHPLLFFSHQLLFLFIDCNGFFYQLLFLFISCFIVSSAVNYNCVHLCFLFFCVSCYFSVISQS